VANGGPKPACNTEGESRWVMAHVRRFVIREWDGTENVVDAKFFHHLLDKVVMKYKDGVCHEVKEKYFWTIVVRPEV